MVYVIVVVPAATPVTNPVVLIVATAELEVVQALEVAAVAVPDNWVVLPTQALKVPVIVGSALIVIETDSLQPLSFV